MKMKKILALLVLASTMLFAAHNASAQIGHFGVKGGLTFSKASMDEIKSLNYTGFHAGVTYQLNLPLGFSIQPELVYQQRGARIKGSGIVPLEGKMSMGFIELPVSVQWGPDLVLFRPYVELVPYIGYAVTNKATAGNLILKNQWNGVNRFEYGLGLGVGIEIWKFQLSGRYCWSFGNVASMKGVELPDSIYEAFDNAKFGGFQLSLAFLF